MPRCPARLKSISIFIYHHFAGHQLARSRAPVSRLLPRYERNDAPPAGGKFPHEMPHAPHLPSITANTRHRAIARIRDTGARCRARATAIVTRKSISFLHQRRFLRAYISPLFAPYFADFDIRRHMSAGFLHASRFTYNAASAGRPARYRRRRLAPPPVNHFVSSYHRPVNTSTYAGDAPIPP